MSSISIEVLKISKFRLDPVLLLTSRENSNFKVTDFSANFVVPLAIRGILSKLLARRILLGAAFLLSSEIFISCNFATTYYQTAVLVYL